MGGFESLKLLQWCYANASVSGIVHVEKQGKIWLDVQGRGLAYTVGGFESQERL